MVFPAGPGGGFWRYERRDQPRLSLVGQTWWLVYALVAFGALWQLLSWVDPYAKVLLVAFYGLLLAAGLRDGWTSLRMAPNSRRD